MARGIAPRMHFRRWFKLHSISPPAEINPLKPGEKRNYDSLPPQVDRRTIANNPPPMRRPIKPEET